MKRRIILALLLLTVAVLVMLPEASASRNYQQVGAVMSHMDMNNQHIPDGATIQLEAKPFVQSIKGSNVTMYGYNGQIPGPMIKVRQGSSIYVNFTNNLDIETFHRR